ncbi:hypothetical protein [Marinagarivorans cellulosilyticus]|uniref:Uncharacterized protein n=1 Tax=Marinagarivorans cellulosilyticus TaxID=2721545 RepID=A0AAN1WLR9_9GAMM|nr:hypothetical protein [Marinagarivorans cellulosilyticus]BCD99929.1 hypothetical protein MARGE09_P4131 [Marinagarivorans cellulosilyticus]
MTVLSHSIKSKLMCIFLCLGVISCGSSGGDNSETKKPVNGGETSSTSSVASNNVKVNLVFPTNLSNLGGVDHSQIQLYVETNDNFGEAVDVTVNDISLTVFNDLWRTDGELIYLQGLESPTLDINVTSEYGYTESSQFMIANNTAIMGGSIYAIDLFFDNVGSVIYAIDENKSALIEVNINSNNRREIYESENILEQKLVRGAFADSQIYLIEEGASLESPISLLTVDSSGVVIDQFNSTSPVNQPVSVFIDNSKELLSSENDLVAYILDGDANDSLSQWFLDGEYKGENYPLLVSTDESTGFSSNYVPSAAIKLGDSILLSRERSSSDGFSSGSLVEVNFAPKQNTYTAKANVFASIDNEYGRIQKPTAMALTHDKTTLYIADQDKIWSMDLTKDDKPFKLITSSSIIPQKLGNGPRLGSFITAIEVHPKYNILYVAAGAQGIIAIDVATGDRITVAK